MDEIFEFSSMYRIPVSFTYQGNACDGLLSPVSGAASSSMFYLLVNNFYRGTLHLSGFNGEWEFNCPSEDPELKALADYFGRVVVAWREGVEK